MEPWEKRGYLLSTMEHVQLHGCFRYSAQKLHLEVHYPRELSWRCQWDKPRFSWTQASLIVSQTIITISYGPLLNSGDLWPLGIRFIYFNFMASQTSHTNIFATNCTLHPLDSIYVGSQWRIPRYKLIISLWTEITRARAKWLLVSR